jgi:AbrB family looped-hinge helix DNA binding protein
MLDVATVTEKGQITIPIDVRRKLKINKGSKVAFVEDSHGRVFIENSVVVALREAQRAFEGEAERLGLTSDEDVVAMIKEVRAQRAVSAS